MQTLTKREKILLYILLCVIIVVGGIFLLNMPALEKHSDLKLEYDNAQAQLKAEKGNIVTYGNLDEEIEKITNDYKQTADNFYTSDMLSEDVDKLITSLAIDHGLVPTGLTIGEISEEEVQSYPDYLKALEENKEGKEANKNLMMKVYNAELRMSGDIGNVQSLVNDANQSKSLKVSSLNYSQQNGEEKDMTITFKIFLI